MAPSIVEPTTPRPVNLERSQQKSAFKTCLQCLGQASLEQFNSSMAGQAPQDVRVLRCLRVPGNCGNVVWLLPSATPTEFDPSAPREKVKRGRDGLAVVLRQRRLRGARARSSPAPSAPSEPLPPCPAASLPPPSAPVASPEFSPQITPEEEPAMPRRQPAPAQRADYTPAQIKRLIFLVFDAKKPTIAAAAAREVGMKETSAAYHIQQERKRRAAAPQSDEKASEQPAVNEARPIARAAAEPPDVDGAVQQPTPTVGRPVDPRMRGVGLTEIEIPAPPSTPTKFVVADDEEPLPQPTPVVERPTTLEERARLWTFRAPAGSCRLPYLSLEQIATYIRQVLDRGVISSSELALELGAEHSDLVEVLRLHPATEASTSEESRRGMTGAELGRQMHPERQAPDPLADGITLLAQVPLGRLVGLREDTQECILLSLRLAKVEGLL